MLQDGGSSFGIPYEENFNALFSCRCDSKGEGKAKVNFREKEKQVLDQILGPGRYDARIRPSGENGTGEFVSVWIPRYFIGICFIFCLKREQKQVMMGFEGYKLQSE